LPTMQKKSEKKDGLEGSFTRLNEIVNRLEQNDCSLEESLKLYEEGVKLAGAAHRVLNEAERKIEILSKSAETGFPISEPFGMAKDGEV